MPGSWSSQQFPNLWNNNCVLTSPATAAYNCIAWAAGDSTRWWWPVPLRGLSYWPAGVPRQETIDAFIGAFATKGFSPCADGSLQDGVEKVALFAKRVGASLVPTHAALQLQTGEWTSKLGTFEDINHLTVDAVNGPAYGEPVQFLARDRMHQ